MHLSRVAPSRSSGKPQPRTHLPSHNSGTGPGFPWKPGPVSPPQPGRVSQPQPGPVPRPQLRLGHQSRCEAEAIVPVEAGILVPVKARRVVLVSRGSRDLYLCCTWDGWSRLRLRYWPRLRLGHWSRLRLGHWSRFPMEARTSPILHKQWTPRPGGSYPYSNALVK